ncbi:DUF4381 domain-containing protein [Vibrio rumoiensis]|uniref:DUF4381 domain-containing protein n=1 Tax=Vibrio rumoiensis 1S-45 TaxID=1188252 RepID=A0A1E5E2D7_9VIBR|nr:DUF4381 domain-containing protein [Vibrio rumoiensis]OEF25583.1 hypothetical protein A1QC_01500 [Vibrio rumoiensis 1S-45]
MTQPAPPGSYILRGLQDVGMPDHVSWMPQTLGWKILGTIICIVLIYFGYKAVQRWWFNRYRLEAIQVTEGLSIDDPKFEYKLFVIIKRVMGHLNPSYHSLFGQEFLSTMTEYPMQSSLKLEATLGDSWMLALTSKQYALGQSDKNTLKQYCLDWFKLHQMKEVQ